jgi:hypothetical protein
MTYKEIIDLRQKLEKAEISAMEAKEIYFANTDMDKKSWYTQDWKDRRNLIIKDKCEQCGGTDTLTLQHLSHPKKYDQYYLDAYNYFNNIFIEETTVNLDTLTTKNDIENYINNTPREIFNMCPKCGGSYHLVKSRQKLVCNRCKYEFDEATSKLLPDYIDDIYGDCDVSQINRPKNAPGNRKVKHVMFFSEIRDKIINQKIKQMMKEKYQLKIDGKAIADYLDAQIKYLSFEDAITLCKKCAFSQDINGKDLCPVCKKNYKKIQYETCIDCMPDGERKNKIKEQLAFYKKMHDMHKNLGID